MSFANQNQPPPYPSPGIPGEGTRTTLSAIVISYNTCQMTLDCLRALTADMQTIPHEIIVVDNASSDGSPPAIRAAFPNVRVIENPDNRGFGAANNQGMSAATGEFFLLINSDAFPKHGAIPAMIDCLRQNPAAALVGPRLINPDGSLQRSCFRFPSPMQAWLENLWISTLLPPNSPAADYRRWPHDRLCSVDFVIGAAMMVRRAVVEQVGGFDEEFFMYSEEADWQKRMTQAGWNILFTPAALVTHLGGASGTAEKSRVNRNFFESLDYYEYKHHGLSGLISLRIAMIIGCSLRAVGWLGCALIPARRQTALAKLKLRLWLIWRQATHWQIRRARPALVGAAGIKPCSDRK
jgi:hypothetical protein